nr:MBL fold metallo-hydrolase [uncultured Bacteroides sp.]
MITRTFHPIGQGAFYSEKHDGFTVVYDCGNQYNTKMGDQAVTQAFYKNENIDILFISHFDYDHISKIKLLNEHAKIKRVIMPLLYKEELIILSNIYETIEQKNIGTLIRNPQAFFGNDTQIIQVRSTEENNIRDEDTNPTIIENLSSGEIINSGVQLSISSNNDWIYVPYNYEYNNRRKNLLDKLEEAGFNEDKFVNDISYWKDIISDREQVKAIKRVYSELSGEINQNSMMIYSGPMNYSPKKYEKRSICLSLHFIVPQNSIVNNRCIGANGIINTHHFRNYTIKSERVACIYTGDGDLNVTNIRDVYRKLWANVGTIQIPHHGSLSSFNENILAPYGYCCPISFGVENPYGHPSGEVIRKILSEGSYPIAVTDQLDSAYFEIIGKKLDL